MPDPALPALELGEVMRCLEPLLLCSLDILDVEHKVCKRSMVISVCYQSAIIMTLEILFSDLCCSTGLRYTSQRSTNLDRHL